MKQFQSVLAIGNTRPRVNGAQLRDGASVLDGKLLHLQALWQMESDDSRYPDEWALGPIDEETKAIFDVAGFAWVASGDVEEMALC